MGNLSDLKRLILNHNQFTGSIPPELGNLANLGYLSLGSNQLTGTIPPELSYLANLRYLSLRYNQLTGTIPPELGYLAKLGELGLSGNQLTGCVPAGLRDVPRNDLAELGLPDCGGVTGPSAPQNLTATAKGATQIDLSWSAPSLGGGSPITGYRIEVSTDRPAWTNLAANTGSTGTSYSHTGLTALSTRHYRVSAINSNGTSQPSNVASATTTSTDHANSGDRDALVALYNVTGGPKNWKDHTNWLSNEPIGQWHGVSTDSDGRVTRLELYGNQLSWAIPPELGNLANLQYLQLGGNQLTGSIPPELGNLRYLNLRGNQLTGTIPPELGNLANLETLDLSHNELTGSIPPELGNLSILQSLYLHGNQLTGSIPPELGNLANLGYLYLANNQLTGCILAGLRDVPNNDVDRLGLEFCEGEEPTPLERFDTDNNGEIDKDEVLQAISDYLFGDEGAVTKDEVLAVISLYLFGA